MNTPFLPDLDWLARNTTGEMLRGGAFGMEREALRVSPEGSLALTPHPAAFGDKLLNSKVTVDFSESQIELITPPCSSVDDTLASMSDIRQEAQDVLARQGERLWPLSMPPVLPADEAIPVARFSDTPEGRMRELYRHGLGNRYGRRMQMISGIHFNMSYGTALLEALRHRAELPGSPRQATDAIYFRAARNFLRNRWLLVLLTGASPAADPSFHGVVRQQVTTVKACCKECGDFIDEHEQHATSLRVSRYGYADTAFSEMPVSFNSLDEYVHDIRKLLATPSEKFAQLGLEKNGKPLQINTNVLQLESEFYAAIRLKGRIRPGEGHLSALERDGVQYFEVRILDLNPYFADGIDIDTLRLLQVFMLDSLLASDAPIDSKEWARLQENHHRVALSGRMATLPLCGSGGKKAIRDLAEPLFARLRAIATLMDRDAPQAVFSQAIAAAWDKIIDPSLLPSARIAQTMAQQGLSHVGFGVQQLASAPALPGRGTPAHSASLVE